MGIRPLEQCAEGSEAGLSVLPVLVADIGCHELQDAVEDLVGTHHTYAVESAVSRTPHRILEVILLFHNA